MNRYAPTVLILLCAAAAVFGIGELFKLRYETGDVYPEYSSLRADPIGTMALYESLDRSSGVSVSRDYSTSNRLPEKQPTTYLHLAGSTDDWRWMPEPLFNEVDRFVRAGGRLVITLHPIGENSRHRIREPDSKTNSPSEKNKKHRRLNREEDHKGSISLSERWDLEFRTIALEHGLTGIYEAIEVQKTSDLPLPETLDWHSAIVLSHLGTAWKTIYSRGADAVVAERSFGRGTVVIATDSYFLSNEAMWKDRHADLIAWFIGDGRNVVFDEAHLGVMENPGVATLMRKYRLHWLTFGLIALAGLFIWKNSFSLVPVHESATKSDFISGKDAASGFVNLLRRNIPVRELLAVSFAEWKKSGASNARYSRARMQQAEAIFQAEISRPAKDQNPIRAYQQIRMVLQRPTRSSDAESSTNDTRRSEPAETDSIL